MSHLASRVMIVTGSGGGLGRHLAVTGAARGARVVVADVNGAAAESSAAAIVSAGGQAEAVKVDVRDGEAMDGLAALAVDRFGRIDIRVNNAGVMPLAFFADHCLAREAWDRCIDISLKGVINGIPAVYDQMMDQGRGHVVNISSIYANAGTAGSGVYSASKAAVAVLSDSLRVESQGVIKVTVVRPTGVMGTGLGAGIVNPAAIIGLTGQHHRQFAETVAAYRNGTLDDAYSDVDQPEYWAITPEVMATEILHAIDQP